MPLLKVFGDESSQNAHRYLVMGVSVAFQQDIDAIYRAIEAKRNEHGFFGELKWTKVSKAKLAAYTDILDTYFDLVRDSRIHFHALAVDTSTMDHDAHSAGNDEIGFNKLIYQLLLHRVGLRYGRRNRLEVRLDARTGNLDPNDLTTMLNAGLIKEFEMYSRPFNFVRFGDSKTYPLIQLTDVLIGAIAYRKNRFHKAPDAAPHKCALVRHIGKRMVEIERRDISNARAVKITLWNFHYQAAKRLWAM